MWLTNHSANIRELTILIPESFGFRSFTVLRNFDFEFVIQLNKAPVNIIFFMLERLLLFLWGSYGYFANSGLFIFVKIRYTLLLDKELSVKEYIILKYLSLGKKGATNLLHNVWIESCDPLCFSTGLGNVDRNSQIFTKPLKKRMIWLKTKRAFTISRILETY
jgi:hypothetical protein